MNYSDVFTYQVKSEIRKSKNSMWVKNDYIQYIWDCVSMLYHFYRVLNETRNFYFCVTPKNQALPESSSLFLK